MTINSYQPCGRGGPRPRLLLLTYPKLQVLFPTICGHYLHVQRHFRFNTVSQLTLHQAILDSSLFLISSCPFHWPFALLNKTIISINIAQLNDLIKSLFLDLMTLLLGMLFCQGCGGKQKQLGFSHTAAISLLSVIYHSCNPVASL